MNCNDIESQIQAKGLTAPRVTPADIEAEIASEWYINGGDAPADAFQPPVPANHPIRRITICLIVLHNGFVVTGESACVSLENFDEFMGRKAARENAVAKIWPLLGFRLRDNLTVRGAVQA